MKFYTTHISVLLKHITSPFDTLCADLAHLHTSNYTPLFPVYWYFFFGGGKEGGDIINLPLIGVELDELPKQCFFEETALSL